MMHERIMAAISEALGEVPAFTFSVDAATDPSFGDFSSNVALVGAKILGQPPRTLAETIVGKLRLPAGVASVSIAGPGFINFTLTRQFFADTVASIRVLDTGYGRGDAYVGKRIVVEHTSPNPNKAMHIGHLRNNVTGMAMVRLFEWQGAQVIAEAVDNNRGIAIAKLMYGYLAFARVREDVPITLEHWDAFPHDWVTPEQMGVLPDRFVDSLYVRGNEAYEADAQVAEKVRQLVVDWEAENPLVWKLWRQVLAYSYAGQQRTLARLGNRWDRVWHEHEHYKEGKTLVAEGVAKGIFQTLPDGAIITNLGTFDLSDTVVQKSDGTALYITQDLALTKLKKTAGADLLMWVIGPEQSLAMRQLFAVCEQLGMGSHDEFVHVPYGYMSIKGVGKMSSRAGTVLYVDEVLDTAASAVRDIVAARETPEVDVDAIAESVAVGAVKYAILRAGRMRDIAFDVAEATRLEGDSGVYVQYAYARARAVCAKALALGVHADPDTPPSESYPLEQMLHQFPVVVERAAREHEPHHVVTYITELAAAFNAFYAHERIAAPEDPNAPYKLALTEAVAILLRNGMTIIGIDAIERL
jgi:arginyl-tRNA synthetase